MNGSRQIENLENLISADFDPERFLKERRFRVLIADDEVDARNLIDVALERDNLDLVMCESGSEAIEQCSTQLPDLAILDVQMPGKNGIEVCKWIKSESGTTFVPVILVTAMTQLDDKLNGLNGGADDYITKPFSLPELEARVDALLRIKVLTDELKRTKDLLADKERELVAMQVAGAAAHELGQPLTTLLLACQLLGNTEQAQEKFHKALSLVQEQCNRMRDILSKLNSVKGYKTTQYPGDLKILDLD